MGERERERGKEKAADCARPTEQARERGGGRRGVLCYRLRLEGLKEGASAQREALGVIHVLERVHEIGFEWVGRLARWPWPLRIQDVDQPRAHEGYRDIKDRVENEVITPRLRLKIIKLVPSLIVAVLAYQFVLCQAAPAAPP